jgi:coenzyme F420-dependent glucose-6-phosphate dehydrogenase
MCQSGEPVVQERPRFVIGKEGQPMAEMGYVLSSEEMSPNEMVWNARRAEEAGFTTAWISDHYHPWIDAQGQSPFVWSVIGGIATATEGIRLGTGVTCPTIRIHPAIIAQATATSAAMLEGRFWFGIAAARTSTSTYSGTTGPRQT